MFKKVIDLLYLAKQNGIDVHLAGEQLQVRTPKNKDFDKNLLDELKYNKALIIDFLKANTRNTYNKIGRFDRDTIDRIPLSFSQERLWFIHQLEGSVQYHMPAVLRLKGKLNRDALIYAFQNIVNRHEVLRSVILEDEGKGYQVRKDKDSWRMEIVDDYLYKENTEELQKYIQELINIPFDLSKDYMMRVHLICINELENVLVVTLHHIASDGWSMSVIVSELVELYKAFEENREADLLPLEIQYADYAVWQRSYLQEEILEKKLAYWKNKLEDTSPLKLPTDYPRPVIQSIKGAARRFKIEQDLSDKLLEFSQLHGATLFMTLLSVYKVLLFRYSGQTDICVGIGIAGRQQPEIEKLIGFFVNTLALRSKLNPSDTFIELMQKVKETTMEAYEHQEVPFEKVVEAIVGDRDMSKNPLVQVMFALQNTPEIPELRLGEVSLFNEEFTYNISKFDMTLYLRETPLGLQGSLEYCTDLFDEQTIDRMIGHFRELLLSVLTDPHQRIGLMPMLSKSENHQLLIEFNDTAIDYPEDKSIVDLFEEQTSKSPDALAIVFEHVKMTYKELNERSNLLAHYLKSKGLKSETPVPIFIERSPEMIVGILGILKAGGAYVPIDPDYPLERIFYMLKDTGASIVVSSKKSKSKLPFKEDLEILELDGEWTDIIEPSAENLRIKVDAHNLAYIIYTSGSTGKPKGVLIEHSSVVNLITWHNNEYEVSALSKATSMSGVGFDAFGWEIWPYLCAGASVHIVDDEKRLHPFELIELFNDSNITHSFIATAIIQDFVNASRNKLKTLKYLLTGGDKLSSLSLDGIEFKFVNNYGPTEYTVVTCNYTLSETEKYTLPPIGKPIANTKIQILSKEGQLVPVGVPGEINILGAGLARGYLNQPELTEEKFIYGSFNKEAKSRMYKTGDIGRWLSDGNIEFYGRLDDQVKIRGYRIELGEIESVLNKLEPVESCCVLIRPDQGNKLVGYYVLNSKVVKEKEQELYRLQIESWKELYDLQYSETDEDSVDEEFNIIGWNDSFTGSAIPAEKMKEWLRDITDVILSGNPGNVLEIGCGTGMIYYQIADKVKKYTGTDFSGTSINQISQRLNKKLREYCPTKLQVCAAHEVSLSDDENIDTIILNSIVQYFPGEEYMNEVIGKSIPLLKGKGRIIIGDVRDNRLLELFKGRLLLQKLQHSVSVKEFNWAMQQDVLKEEELCFSPEYFYRLQSVYPEITHIEIKWKQASYINELSLYRYTVVIYVGQELEIIRPDWKDWNEEGVNKQSVFDQLEKGCSSIALKNVPNPRLWKENVLSNSIKNKTAGTVGELLRKIENEDTESKEIMEILNLAESENYSCRLLLDEDPLKINLLIEQNPSDSFIELPFSKKFQSYNNLNTNIPLFNDISSQLKKKIRAMMLQSLPEYMVPSDLIALNHLPLTNNGKIDRNFLSRREDLAVSNKLNYRAPGNDTEKMLSNIWQTLLGIERIGVRDNFFELGGHSLLALRLFSNIEKLTGRKLPISTLFNSPTIEDLAKILNNEGWTPTWKSLVAVKPDGSKLPLFCIPAAASTALSFQELSKYLLPDQPLYALDPIGIDGKEPPQNDIVEMATYYIKEIQLLQPKGPYLLGGRCLGSTVAFEMAQQLKSAGEEVALVLVLDTRPPVETLHWILQPRVKKHMRHFVNRSIQNLMNGTLLTVIKNYSANKIHKIKIIIRKKVELILSDPKKRLYKEILFVHMSAWVRYIAKKYYGKIILIEAEEFENEDRIGWKNLAQDGLESYVIPGTNHFTIFQEPYIKLFTEKLNYILEKTHREIESKSNVNGVVDKSIKKGQTEKVSL